MVADLRVRVLSRRFQEKSRMSGLFARSMRGAPRPVRGRVMGTEQKKSLFALHILFMVYSVASLMSKLAAGHEFLSFEFVALYGSMIVVLAVYALVWQQLLKRLPLATAYANKAVTVVWGFIWGILFFAEQITPLKIVGAILVIAGVVLYSYADFGGKGQEGGEEAAS